ncbi:hypothetical protein E7811_09260 [Aliigemmobacter aestuarii]|uniref:Uncharacterized protein n=1 Tax=Aliigemmobacter aestuarii TaxID=1445661 RepID=A0A4S3MP15_9RHOB|nr:hypothetical protein [Gemmobacter aestuarii]THD83465.1 hypothetical protein E7811_09260 [Gemmobacter aestuarii]
MADITIKAAYATVADEDGLRFVGFVTADEDGYALFRQPMGGGPIWFELNDEDLGAEDAVERIIRTATGLEVTIRPARVSRFGFAGSVTIRLDRCEGAEAALQALADMLGDRLEVPQAGG